MKDSFTVGGVIAKKASVSPRRAGRLLALFVVLLASAAPRVASGQQVDAIRAEELFHQGRILLSQGHIERACVRFEESLRADPNAVGTMLNLAGCNERRGKLATALVQFRSVAARSRGTRPDRVKTAEARIKLLEPRLSRVTIEVDAPADDESVVVSLDGAVLPRAEWGQPRQSDGDRHEVRVEALQRQTTTTTFELANERQSLVVRVAPGEAIAPVVEPPPVAPQPVVPSPVAPPVEAPRKPEIAAPRVEDQTASSTRRTAGFVIGGAGLAALGVGATFGALSLGADASRPCSPSCTAGSDAARLDDERFDRANTFANVSNVTIPVGVVLLAVGAYLVLTSPRRSTSVAWPSSVAGSVR